MYISFQPNNINSKNLNHTHKKDQITESTQSFHYFVASCHYFFSIKFNQHTIIVTSIYIFIQKLSKMGVPGSCPQPVTKCANNSDPLTLYLTSTKVHK